MKEYKLRIMNKEVRLKAVIFYSVILFATIVAIDLLFMPGQFLNAEFLLKKLDKITAAQKIAPQRLFVHVWRTARNEYFDVSMNSQNWLRWRNRYLKHIKTMEDADIAINSMLASLNDPYTKFLVSDVYSKQKDVIDSKVTGIGIIVNKSGDSIVISHVMENSPAQKSQILPGDIILEINGKTVENQEVDKIFASDDLVKSKTVKVKIKRNNKVIEKTLKKAVIPIRTMDYKITHDGIAIITLATIMGEQAISDFVNIIQVTNDADAIIIDLRDNYGGILLNAIEMANYMLDNEKIVSVESRGNNKFQIYASKEGIFKKKNIVILVNKNTASAAEILAGTLKDNLGAIVIGENTYGKNSIQQVIPMYNNTGLIITSNRYILPVSGDIHNKGITPDIYIRQKNNYSDRHNDKVMKEALKIVRKMMKNKK